MQSSRLRSVTLPFACEASALTTEPPGTVVVEVTRMPNICDRIKEKQPYRRFG